MSEYLANHQRQQPLTPSYTIKSTKLPPATLQALKKSKHHQQYQTYSDATAMWQALEQ